MLLAFIKVYKVIIGLAITRIIIVVCPGITYALARVWIFLMFLRTSTTRGKTQENPIGIPVQKTGDHVPSGQTIMIIQVIARPIITL